MLLYIIILLLLLIYIIIIIIAILLRSLHVEVSFMFLCFITRKKIGKYRAAENAW